MQRPPLSMPLRTALLLLVLWPVLWLALDWRDPLPAERQLAEQVAQFCRQQLGNLPAPSHERPVPGGRALGYRAATHGLVVLIVYGYQPDRDLALLEPVVQQAFRRFPGLQVVSLEFYQSLQFSRLADGSYVPRREIYLGRQTVSPVSH